VCVCVCVYNTMFKLLSFFYIYLIVQGVPKDTSLV